MIQMLFATFIYNHENLLPDEEYSKVINACNDLKNVALEKSKWACDVSTSYFKPEFNLKNNDKFNFLIENIKQHVFAFCNSLQSFPQGIKTTEAWFNVSNKGQYQEQHIHPGKHISAIYYVEAPEGSARTIFKHPYYKMIELPNIANAQYVQPNAVYPSKPNMLVLFESHIPHLTEQHMVDGERTTIAVNFNLF